MKKNLGQYVIAVLGIFVVALVFWGRGADTPTLGSVGLEPSFSGVTNSFTNCSGATSTLIVATSTGRTSFSVAINATSTGAGQGGNVYVCRAANCMIGKGIPIGASTTQDRYIQNDSYIGPYTCIAQFASTSVATTHSE